jgi:hypothetical protein
MVGGRREDVKRGEKRGEEGRGFLIGVGRAG